MKLIEYSVKNYQLTLILSVMAAVIGLVTLFTMPRAEDPELKAPFYTIIAVYPGTNPQDMEELIVKPIENKIYELEDINKIITNIEDGLMVSRIDFKFGVDVDNKYQEIIREVNGLREQLPKDLYQLEVKRFDPTDVNIFQIGLTSENASYKTLKFYAEDLKDELEKITALKKVEYSGIPEEIVKVELQMDKLAQLGIPLNVVAASLQSEALNIPAGSINASTRSFTLKTSGKYNSVEDIAATVVHHANGKIIHLKDIADVALQFDEEKHITRINGYRSVLVNAAQKSGLNIAQTKQLSAPVLDAFEKKLPPNIKMITTFDQAKNVSRRLGHLGEDFLIAIGLVLITLLPLGFRAASIVAVAIPLSLGLGIVGLNAFGYSLNQLSIVGLVVALGLLVDDSIVVVENIERWLREGYSKKQAAIKATGQIGYAVLGCTATLIVAFLPLLFLPAGPGAFVRGLPVAVVSSVLASMLVSLTIVPFLASRFLKEHTTTGNIFLKGLKKIIHLTYSKWLDKFLSYPRATLLAALLICVGSFALFPILGFKLFPTSEKPIFLMNIRMPQQTNLSESDRITRIIEDSLRKNERIVYFTTNVGKGNPYIYYNVTQQREKADFSQVFVQLKEDLSPDEKKQVIEALREQFRNFPLAKVEVSDFEQGPPVEAPVSIRLFGDNLDTLRRLAAAAEQIVRKAQGAIYVGNELNMLKTDLRLSIDRQKARTLGVLTADIDKTVRLAVAGTDIGLYTDENGDDYKIVVRAPRSKFASLETFENLYVNNMSGVPVPLRQLAVLSFETSPTTINHFNKNRFAKITAYTQKGVLANDIYREIVPWLDSLHMPAGYYYTLAGEAESEEETFGGGGFITVLLLTLFLFIAVLIIQFKTFKGILIVLSVIPLGIVGGVLMLFLSGNSMSLSALIGFIGLTGIEVKNSILLVDFTNQLRRQGVPLLEAIEQAGELRFLPVVLTSLTAIGGLIPLALNPNQQISPLAWVLIGGLVSSTLLSRIVTPVLYKLLPPKI